MDHGADTEDTQRVRILTTLESTHPASRPARGQRRPKARTGGRSWWQFGLWGAMGTGVLALFAGFILVIQDIKPAATTPTPKAALSPAPAMSPLLEKSAPGALADAAPPTPAGPAVIETSAHADAQAPALANAASAALPAATGAAPLAMTLALAKDGKPAAPPSNPAASAKPAKIPKAAPAVASTKPQDEDVALLEAMFAHTGRKTPSKPASARN